MKVHGYIFQDVYDWAGQYRKVNISKQGNAFMAMQAFDTAETYMNSLLDDFHKKAKSREQIIQHLAKILDNENYFHPFREGKNRNFAGPTAAPEGLYLKEVKYEPINEI